MFTVKVDWDSLPEASGMGVATCDGFVDAVKTAAYFVAYLDQPGTVGEASVLDGDEVVATVTLTMHKRLDQLM